MEMFLTIKLCTYAKIIYILFKLGEPDMQDIAGEAEMNS